MKWHPDRHSGSSEAQRKEAEAKFKDIQCACELLSCPQRRRLYDQGYDIEDIEQRVEMENQQRSGGGGGILLLLLLSLLFFFITIIIIIIIVLLL